MYEIEIKAYCDNIGTFTQKLIGMGAEMKHELYQKDIYFSHPMRDFRETDEAFRIRTVNGVSSVTYKGPKLSTKTKTRVEYETTVGSFDSIFAILRNLGFVEGALVEKTRIEYVLEEVTVCIDSVTGLGDFVELEKIGTDIETTERHLFDLADRLGLDRFEKRSYLNLITDSVDERRA
ncbi:MAG: class IV adenylate cyclase [Spirochaetota bacterium]